MNTDLDHMAYNFRFFNFTAEQVSAERKILVHSLINNAVNMAIKKLETPATSALLAAKKDDLVRSLQDACENKLQRLRELDNTIFNVPAHVLQVQDFDLEHNYTSADEEKKTVKLQELKSRFQENRAMLAELKAEQDNYAALEELIQQELHMHKKVYEACASFEFNKLHKLANEIMKDEQQRQ